MDNINRQTPKVTWDSSVVNNQGKSIKPHAINTQVRIPVTAPTQTEQEIQAAVNAQLQNMLEVQAMTQNQNNNQQR